MIFVPLFEWPVPAASVPAPPA